MEYTGGGVYELVNVPEQKRYIGSTNNVQRRYWRHITELRSNCHPCKRLQDDFNRLSEEQFAFNVLDRSDDPEELQRLEAKRILQSGDYDYNWRHVRAEPLNEIGSIEWIKDMQAIIDDVRVRKLGRKKKPATTGITVNI